MRKIFYRPGNGIALNEDKDLEYLEKMAANGYEVIGVTFFGFYKFKKISPQNLTYQVDFSTITRNSKEFENYKEILASGGWNYIFSVGQNHFFKGKKGTTPLYTDLENKSKKYENMYRQAIHSFVFSAFCSIISLSLTVILPRPFLYIFIICSGASVGLCLVALAGIFQNKRLAEKIKSS